MRGVVLERPIRTDRLRIREFAAQDVPAVLAASDERAMAYFDEAPFSRQAAETWVASAIDDQTSDPRMRYAFAVELASRSEVIGYCDLVIRAPIECRMAYSGYRYAGEHWGNGYGTEAELALFEFGFEVLGLMRISAVAEPENVGSWRIMEKCGMRREGHEILGDWSTKRRCPVDRYLYAIRIEDWRRR